MAKTSAGTTSDAVKVDADNIQPGPPSRDTAPIYVSAELQARVLDAGVVLAASEADVVEKRASALTVTPSMLSSTALSDATSLIDQQRVQPHDTTLASVPSAVLPATSPSTVPDDVALVEGDERVSSLIDSLYAPPVVAAAKTEDGAGDLPVETPADISLILELIGLDEQSAPTNIPAVPIKSRDATTASALVAVPHEHEREDDSDASSENELNIREDDDSSSTESDSAASSFAVVRRPQERGRQVLPQSDDEDDSPATFSAVATAHEIIRPAIVLPDVSEVDADEELVRIGEVMSIIDSVVVVQGHPRPDFVHLGEVLDTDSLLVFDNRKVLGQVFETFGPLKLPMYSVRFPDAKSIDKDLVLLRRPVYHVPRRSFFVSPNSLHSKGSDASNFYDEEPGDDEVEFSDDEQEAEHRRALKSARRRDHPANSRIPPSLDPYDDAPSSSHSISLPYDDDPYAIVQPEAPTSVETLSSSQPQRPIRGRGRGRGSSGEHSGRGRGRGRGRGTPRHDQRAPQAPYPARRPSNAARAPDRPPQHDSIDIAIANATGQWNTEFGPAHSYRDSSAYSPAAPSSGFYPSQTMPAAPHMPFSYGQPPAQSFPFVAPHINPRFAAQFGFGMQNPFAPGYAPAQGYQPAVPPAAFNAFPPGRGPQNSSDYPSYAAPHPGQNSG